MSRKNPDHQDGGGVPRKTRHATTRLIPLSIAILVAGEDRWTVERHGVGRSTRYDYEKKGIPAREVANDLYAWFDNQRGPVPDRSPDEDPDFDLEVRLKQTREFHRVVGVDNTVWSIIGQAMTEEHQRYIQALPRTWPARDRRRHKIGRASCRERVCLLV